MVETWWAIGSTPGGADVQPLVSIGTAAFAMNKSLEGLLLENQTYYVTLVSVNGAGLTTTNTSQGGLSPNLHGPVVPPGCLNIMAALLSFRRRF